MNSLMERCVFLFHPSRFTLLILLLPGCKGEFPGLLGVVNAYVNSLNVDVATKCDIRKYLNLIKERASGTTGFIYTSPH